MNIHQENPQKEVGLLYTALSLVTKDVKDETQFPIK